METATWRFCSGAGVFFCPQGLPASTWNEPRARAEPAHAQAPRLIGQKAVVIPHPRRGNQLFRTNFLADQVDAAPFNADRAPSSEGAVGQGGSKGRPSCPFSLLPVSTPGMSFADDSVVLACAVVGKVGGIAAGPHSSDRVISQCGACGARANAPMVHQTS